MSGETIEQMQTTAELLKAAVSAREQLLLRLKAYDEDIKAY